MTASWEQAPIVRLTGPRRVGKTVLAHSLPDTVFPSEWLDSYYAREWDVQDFVSGWTNALGSFAPCIPGRKNYVVCPLLDPAFPRKQNGYTLTFLSPADLRQML